MAEARKVHDCIVDQAFSNLNKELDLNNMRIDEFSDKHYFVNALIRHTLNMALEICK